MRKHYDDIIIFGYRNSDEGFQGDFEAGGSATIESNEFNNMFKIVFDDDCDSCYNGQKVFYFEVEDHDYDEELGERFYGYCVVPLDDVFNGCPGYGVLTTLYTNTYNDEEDSNNDEDENEEFNKTVTEKTPTAIYETKTVMLYDGRTEVYCKVAFDNEHELNSYILESVAEEFGYGYSEIVNIVLEDAARLEPIETSWGFDYYVIDDGIPAELVKRMIEYTLENCIEI